MYRESIIDIRTGQHVCNLLTIMSHLSSLAATSLGDPYWFA